MISTQRKSFLGGAALTLLLLGAAVSVDAQPAAQVDLLIKNGHVVDGTGGSWFQADVAISRSWGSDTRVLVRFLNIFW